MKIQEMIIKMKVENRWSLASLLSVELDYESDEKALCALGNCWELKSGSSLTRFLMSVLT